jgi:hypothetical protein
MDIGQMEYMYIYLNAFDTTEKVIHIYDKHKWHAKIDQRLQYSIYTIESI